MGVLPAAPHLKTFLFGTAHPQWGARYSFSRGGGASLATPLTAGPHCCASVPTTLNGALRGHGPGSSSGGAPWPGLSGPPSQQARPACGGAGQRAMKSVRARFCTYFRGGRGQRGPPYPAGVAQQILRRKFWGGRRSIRSSSSTAAPCRHYAFRARGLGRVPVALPPQFCQAQGSSSILEGKPASLEAKP
jgi:hypothetical protein